MAKKIGKMEQKILWGEGRTALFIAPTKSGSFELLDCKFQKDREKMKCLSDITFKVSRTGKSGSGKIFDMGSLIPVGGYPTDLVNNTFHLSLFLMKDVEIMFPYSWFGDKKTPLEENPVVIIRWDFPISIIFCPYGPKLWETLELLSAGKMPKEAPEYLTKQFVRYTDEKRELLKIKFYDLLDYRANHKPWEFLLNQLPHDVFPAPRTELEKQLQIHITKAGNVVNLQKIGGKFYGCDIQPLELLLRGKLQIPGWESAGANLYYKVGKEMVTLLPFFPAEEYWKRVNRLLRDYPNPKKTSWQAENIWPASWAPGTIIAYGREIKRETFFANKEALLQNTKRCFKRLMLIKALDYVTMMVTSLEYQPKKGKEE